ncbi:MAG TPA: hypothetical protein VF791_17225 [Pyrinomonadaceae bacterium]
MRKSTLALSLLLMALLGRPAVIQAQQKAAPPAGTWNTVQELSPGDEIEIRLNDGMSLRGRFSNASDAKLAFRKSGKTMELFRSEIFEVYRLVPKSKTKSVLLGLGIGAGAGVGVGGIVGASTGPHESGEAHLPAAQIGVVGAGVGALVGFFLGRGKNRVLIYRAA